MPEAPDLHVIRDFLERTLTGVSVTDARVLRPIVLRSLAAPDFGGDITGRTFRKFWRKGKVLGLELSGERLLVINPMLSGGLQHCDPKERVSKKTFIILGLSNGKELRYFDDDQMGMVYYLTPDQLGSVPRLIDQGPDVLDKPLTLPQFKAALKPFRGEVKGILTRGELVSGIGNAYADEVCFAAGIHPFRKVTSLKPEELERFWRATYDVPKAAIPILKKRVGDNIHLKVRDFLKVHGKAGQPCPQCGGRITEIRANGRLHNYCRTCQPGSLFGDGLAAKTNGYEKAEPNDES